MEILRWDTSSEGPYFTTRCDIDLILTKVTPHVYTQLIGQMDE